MSSQLGDSQQGTAPEAPPTFRGGRRQAAKEALKLSVRRAAGRFGLEVSSFKGSFAAHRSRLLREMNITVVYDIGANVGQYAVAIRGAGYGGRIVSVEPNPAAFQALHKRAAPDTNWIAVEAALGETAGTAALHVARNSQSSSILQIEDRHTAAYPASAYVADVQVKVRTLDDLVAETASEQDALFAKLDVQGYEAVVFSGAPSSLPRFAVVEVECSLTELYGGQPPAWRLLDWLVQQGFTATEVERVCWDQRSGDLLQINVLMRRSED